MRKILKTIREIAGKKIKTLYLPIVLSCMDSCHDGHRALENRRSSESTASA